MTVCYTVLIPRCTGRGPKQGNIFVFMQTFPSALQTELLPHFTDEAAEYQELVQHGHSLAVPWPLETPLGLYSDLAGEASGFPSATTNPLK